MKNCELCNGLARIYCESDHANLCWDCDMKVHSANFLVAKHSRSLLCHVCQSPTAWSATGAKIGRTVSVCERCSNNNNNTPSIIPQVRIREGRVYVDIIPTLAGRDEIDGEEDERIDDNNDVEQEEEEIDLEDIQVVPWSSTPPPPPPSGSSSSSEESLKRMREDDV
ncbi:zinc finger protein CONSTANS-LIKE 9-like [Lycium ferocissimum]|uniref:zinc finger protein CONSTANS-LIKE 9-like n=1 Tax=Lycium ferocissimum TaxID=112874 RepID=UPI002815BB62|nr:zinc finger protein CONSTANS-LIKE 9-like [Lycium ferocissimum]